MNIYGFICFFQRIRKDLKDLEVNPIKNISVSPVKGDLFHWLGVFIGPEETPYYGGTFKIAIHIPDDYPLKEPKLKMKTKIYHPDITSDGHIVLQEKHWSPANTVGAYLLAMYDFIFYPQIEWEATPSLEHIGKEFKWDRDQFNETAKKWTQKYAA